MSALHNLLIHIHKPMHIHVLHVLIPASYDGSVRLPPPPFYFLFFWPCMFLFRVLFF